MPRYRFSEFILSPRRRALVRNGREQPLIPRYFDLLVFLVERRSEAVHRRDIFERVWSDVVVSDSALSQAIRTIRRMLGDDSREPRFMRTVSRHGYQFVFADVVEEDDNGEWPGAEAPAAVPETAAPAGRSLRRRCSSGSPALQPARAKKRSSAKQPSCCTRWVRPKRCGGWARVPVTRSHARCSAIPAGRRPRLARSRSLVSPVRSRWPGTWSRLRLRRAARIAAARWAAASVGGGVAGALAGAAGGVLLALAPGSAASLAVVPVLAVIGGCCGAIGARRRRRRTVDRGVGRPVATDARGDLWRRALGGALPASWCSCLARWSLVVLVGIDVQLAEVSRVWSSAAPRDLAMALATARARRRVRRASRSRRLRAARLTAGACGLAALALAWRDDPWWAARFTPLPRRRRVAGRC